MSCWESLPFFTRDKVFYLLPVNNIILLCKLGIVDYNQDIKDFTGNHSFRMQYYQRNPYEYIKYQLRNKGKNNDPDGILRRAAELGILVAIQEALKKGANIHARNDFVLQLVARKGYLEIVEYLVNKGANIHANNDLAVIEAASNGHLEIVKFLVENGADIHADNNFAIERAVDNGHFDVVKFLVEDLDTDIPALSERSLKRAAKNGHLDLITYLVSKGANIHSLINALNYNHVIVPAESKGYLDVVKYLVCLGVVLIFMLIIIKHEYWQHIMDIWMWLNT